MYLDFFLFKAWVVFVFVVVLKHTQLCLNLTPCFAPVPTV